MDKQDKELLTSLHFNKHQLEQIEAFALRQDMGITRLLNLALKRYQAEVEPIPEEFLGGGCGGHD